MRDEGFRILPHRDVNVIRGDAWPPEPRRYEHRPCGMDLTELAVKEENWCPYCVAYINKAAKRRAEQERRR